MSTNPDADELTDEFRARVESERLESRNRREGDAALWGVSTTGALMTLGLSMIRLTHLRIGPVGWTVLIIGSYIGGHFVGRWHKRRD